MRKNYVIVAMSLYLIAFFFDIGDIESFAGTDSTFGTTTTGPLGSITKWLTGSMGKLFALGALGVGLGVGIVKQSIMAVSVGVGLSLAASAGPAVLAGMFSATL